MSQLSIADPDIELVTTLFLAAAYAVVGAFCRAVFELEETWVPVLCQIAIERFSTQLI